MTIDRAIEILNPEHREHYDGMDEVNEACRMGMEALERGRNAAPVVRCRDCIAFEEIGKHPTYMDCWHFIAPLIPVDTDYTMDIYTMVFKALKEAEKKRIAKKKGGEENG